jgi:leucyl aminopeptidase
MANTRGSIANPQWMEDRVSELLEKSDAAKTLIKELRILRASQLQELGMNLFYNVGKGAVVEPRCIMVHYEGNPDSQDIDIALIGKGVTYDTGGLNLKPTGSMETMYGDKNGSCAVLGALHGALSLKPRKNIVFAIGLAENAIDSKSYKPGDIITSMKGLTVEIGNTDAEGRLVLADTMTYVQQEFKPKQMVELSTLTGACMVALGNETAGLFSNDDKLAEMLQSSSKRSFEQIWRLPIMDEHRETMKSSFADLNNKGKTPYGGASQAAAFLERFVEKDVKWAHLDIAGPGMASAAKAPVCANGTGFGTHLLIDYLTKQ